MYLDENIVCSTLDPMIEAELDIYDKSKGLAESEFIRIAEIEPDSPAGFTYFRPKIGSLSWGSKIGLYNL